jgi:hypothetical protein
MFGLSALLSNVIAGVLAATTRFGAWSWVQLQTARADLAEARAGLYRAEQININTVDQLADASLLLADQVNKIAVNERALAEAMAERDRVVKERNWAWLENSELLEQAYAVSCIEWSETQMCTEVLEQWRSEYQQLQQQP